MLSCLLNTPSAPVLPRSPFCDEPGPLMGLGRNSGQGLYVTLHNGERASTPRFWAPKINWQRSAARPVVEGAGPQTPHQHSETPAPGRGIKSNRLVNAFCDLGPQNLKVGQWVSQPGWQGCHSAAGYMVMGALPDASLFPRPCPCGCKTAMCLLLDAPMAAGHGAFCTKAPLPNHQGADGISICRQPGGAHLYTHRGSDVLSLLMNPRAWMHIPEHLQLLSIPTSPHRVAGQEGSGHRSRRPQGTGLATLAT